MATPNGGKMLDSRISGVLRYAMTAIAVFIAANGAALNADESSGSSALQSVVLPDPNDDGERIRLEEVVTQHQAVDVIYPNGVSARARAWVNGEPVSQILRFQAGGGETLAIPLEPGRNTLNLQLRGVPVDQSDGDPVIWEYEIPVRFNGSIPVTDVRSQDVTEAEIEDLQRRARERNGGEPPDLTKFQEPFEDEDDNPFSRR